MLNQPSLQLLTDKFQHLGYFEQKELLDFAEFLSQKQQTAQPYRSIKGLCADLKIDLSDDDIKIARKEMWDNFAKGKDNKIQNLTNIQVIW
jgi:hypothetical protein